MAELTYESAFPGRFLKAALFDGKHVTVTIESAFLETLEGDKGKESKLIIAFVSKTMQMVCNKTNAVCLKEMFGNKVSAWIGKRVVLYPTRAAFGPKQVDAIRVFGSPDIHADVEVTARIGRKNFKVTMKAVGARAPVDTGLDPNIMTALGILGISHERGRSELAASGGDSVAYMTDLSNRIDEMNQSG